MSRVYSREEVAAMSRGDLEDACVGLSSDVSLRDARIAELEARVRELTEWVRGVPDNAARHWALVWPDGNSTPRVMQWEPVSGRWHESGGSISPYECRHTAALPGVEP